MEVDDRPYTLGSEEAAQETLVRFWAKWAEDLGDGPVESRLESKQDKWENDWRNLRFWYTSPFRSKQIGKVVPESVKEQELAERMGMLNPKGFRIYSSKSPAPTICAYGSEKYCGPGGHAQFIADNVGIRT
jgi:hypothetical protein